MDHPVVLFALMTHCSGCLGTHKDRVFLNKTETNCKHNGCNVVFIDSHLAMVIGPIYTAQNVFRSPEWMSKITVVYES